MGKHGVGHHASPSEQGTNLGRGVQQVRVSRSSPREDCAGHPGRLLVPSPGRNRLRSINHIFRFGAGHFIDSSHHDLQIDRETTPPRQHNDHKAIPAPCLNP